MDRRRFLSWCAPSMAAAGAGCGLVTDEDEGWISIRLKNLTLDRVPLTVSVTEDPRWPFGEETVFEETYETEPRWSPRTEGRDHITVEEQAFRASNGDRFVVSVVIPNDREETFPLQISCWTTNTPPCSSASSAIRTLDTRIG